LTVVDGLGGAVLGGGGAVEGATVGGGGVEGATADGGAVARGAGGVVVTAIGGADVGVAGDRGAVVDEDEETAAGPVVTETGDVLGATPVATVDVLVLVPS
jgi:hypothetical protein